MMEYRNVKIPLPMSDKIDKFREANPEFVSRSDFVKYIIRLFFEDNGGSKNYQPKSEERKDGTS